MRFILLYHQKVVTQDIPRLSITVKKRIQATIEKKLLTEPEVFGVPLRKSLKGYRKLRVGDYRVIFRIEDNVIKIFVIGHRSIIYKFTDKRIY